MNWDNLLRKLRLGGDGPSRRGRERDPDDDPRRTIDGREEKRRLEEGYASRAEFLPPTAPSPSDPDPPPSNRRFLSQPWRQRTPEERRDMKKKAKKCCKRSTRYLFFIFNVVLLIFGGCLTGAAVWIRSQTAEFFEVERDDSEMVVLLETTFECLLGVGATFFGIALFGIVAECAREPFCLIVYIMMMIVFLLCQLIPVCSFVDHAPYYGEKVRSWMTDTLDEKYIGANPTGEHRNAYSFAFDALNMVLKCCGVNNGSDFVVRTNGFWKQNKLMEIGFEFTYPATCCKMDISEDYQKFTAQNKRCLFEPSEENTWMKVGCYQRISELLSANKGKLLGIFSVFIIYEIVCVLLAVFEILKIRWKDKKSGEQYSVAAADGRRFQEERL